MWNQKHQERTLPPKKTLWQILLGFCLTWKSLFDTSNSLWNFMIISSKFIFFWQGFAGIENVPTLFEIYICFDITSLYRSYVEEFFKYTIWVSILEYLSFEVTLGWELFLFPPFPRFIHYYVILNSDISRVWWFCSVSKKVKNIFFFCNGKIIIGSYFYFLPFVE